MKIRNIVAWLLVLTVCLSATCADAELSKASKAKSAKNLKDRMIVSFEEYKLGDQSLKWKKVKSATAFNLAFFGTDGEEIAHYRVDGSSTNFNLNEFKTELVEAELDWNDSYTCKLSAYQKDKVLSEATLKGITLKFTKKASEKKAAKREPSSAKTTPSKTSSKNSSKDDLGEFAKDLLKESAKTAVMSWILRR